MGRKKIKIEPIQEGRNRQVTYLKRKAGLFKKAYELATLTDSQVAVIVFGHNGRLSQFCSADMDAVLLKYTEHDGPVEHKGPQDFSSAAGGDGPGDDEEEDGEEGGPDFFDPRGPPGGPGGPSGGGSSGSGNSHVGGGYSLPGQGGYLGPSGSYNSGTAGNSMAGNSSSGGMGGYKRGRDQCPSRAATDLKTASTSSSKGPPSAALSVTDKQKLRNAIRRMPGAQASAPTSASGPSGFAVRATQNPAVGQYGGPQSAPQQPTQDSLSGTNDSGSRPLSSPGPSHWPSADGPLAPSSSSSPSSTPWPLPTSSAPHWSQSRRYSEIPHSETSPAVITRSSPADSHNSAAQGREGTLRFDQDGAMAESQREYFASSKGGLSWQQQLLQRRATVANLSNRQPSLASLDGSSSAPVSRIRSQGTTPFLPGMPMTNMGLPSGNGAVDSETMFSPPSAPGSSYAYFGGTGRFSLSRDESTPSLSASSLPITRYGTDEYGTSSGPSGSSSDGTPLLVDSRLTTPGESPIGSLQTQGMPLMGGTGYFETKGMPAPTKPMIHQLPGVQQQQQPRIMAFTDPAQATFHLPYFDGAPYPTF